MRVLIFIGVFSFSSLFLTAQCDLGLQVSSNPLPGTIPGTTSLGFCTNQPITLLTDLGYDSYQWLKADFKSDITQLEYVPTGTGNADFDTLADLMYITVIVTQGACVDTLEPFLIDGMVWFLDAEDVRLTDLLCDGKPGRLNFPEENLFTSFNWMKDGVVIPGETDQTLSVTSPGLYEMQFSPVICPTFPFVSSYSCTVEDTFPSLAPEVVMIGNELSIDWSATYDDYQWVLYSANNYSAFLNNFKWYKDGLLVSSLNQDFYTPTENGSYTVEYYNGCEIISSAPFGVLSTGVRSYNISGDFSVELNGRHLMCLNPNNEIGELCVFDLTGKSVLSTMIDGGNLEKDIEFISPGLYLIQFHTGKKKYSQKIVLRP